MSRGECPKGCDNRAGRIDEDALARGLYGPWDGKEERYYSSIVGIEVPEKFDGVSYWLCPKCGTTWDRWNGEVVEL